MMKWKIRLAKGESKDPNAAHVVVYKNKDQRMCKYVTWSVIYCLQFVHSCLAKYAQQDNLKEGEAYIVTIRKVRMKTQASYQETVEHE